MKVVVLTTSYPRDESDVAGRFVADAVRGVRGLGVEVAVVSPSDFADFGLAYGDGIAQNLRRSPWRVGLVPAFVAAYARAARAAARGADLVHAHWIPSAVPAIATGKPYVLQVWGTDVELFRHASAVARPLVRRAELVIAASGFLAAEAAALGAREVRVIPFGVELPAGSRQPDQPPHVLYAGRLSGEKGILEFVEATGGMPRVIVGDGPLRDRVPDAVGFVAPSELGRYYERAAVFCSPSRREGYGLAAREAMAHERPVVATRVGGLADLRGDGVVHVEPRDVDGLRAAIARLLADPGERARRGAAAAATAAAEFSAPVAAAQLVDAYRAALGA